MSKSIQNNKINRYAYVIVFVAFFTIFVSDYSAYQVPPLSHLIIPALNIDESQFAILFAAYMIPGIILCTVAGMLCDKFGARVCIGIALVFPTIAVIFRVFTTSYSAFYICMLTLGIIPAFVATVTPKLISNWMPPQKVSIMVGIALAGGTVGTTAAMSTSAIFPSLKTAFTTSAIFCTLAFVLWIVLIRDKPKEPISGSNISSDTPQVPLLEGLKKVITNKHMWLIGICMGLVLAPAVCTSTFLPRALQLERGMDAVAAGALSSVVTLGNIAGTIFGPIICMLIGKLKPYLFCTCMVMSIGIAFSWKITNSTLAVVCLFITGFAIAAVITQLISLPIFFKEIGPPLAGTAVGFVSTIRLVFAVVLPSYVITPITGNNFSLLFIIAGSLPIVASFLSLLIPDFFSKKSLPE